MPAAPSPMATTRVRCPRCFAEFSAQAAFLGKRARCRQCGQAFEVTPTSPTQIPEAGSPAPEPAGKDPDPAVEDTAVEESLSDTPRPVENVAVSDSPASPPPPAVPEAAAPDAQEGVAAPGGPDSPGTPQSSEPVLGPPVPPKPVPAKPARGSVPRPPAAPKPFKATPRLEDPFPKVPEKIGRFRIIRKVGGGGMGVVYEAHDPRLDRSVALKVPRLERKSRTNTRRLAVEARSSARLHHPNIITTYDFGEEADGTVYLVQEFVDGVALEHLIDCWQANGPAPITKPDRPTLVGWVRDLARALDYAHQLNVIHRDMKPGNVIVSVDGEQPRLTDFGLARCLDDVSRRMTLEGGLVGTPHYMSPEQAAGKSDVGPLSDQHNLAVMMFELLAERKPRSGPSTAVLAELSAGVAPPSLYAFDGTIPRPLSDACRVAMDPEPSLRFESCAAFADALEAALRETYRTKNRPSPGAHVLDPDEAAPVSRQQAAGQMASLIAASEKASIERRKRGEQVNEDVKSGQFLAVIRSTVRQSPVESAIVVWALFTFVFFVWKMLAG